MPPAAHPDRPAVLADAPAAVDPTDAPTDAPYGPGVAVWDLTTDEVYWSPEVFALFGRDRAAGALTLDQLPAYLLPDDQLPLQSMVTAALVDGRAMAGEIRLVRPDGTVHTVRCAGEPVIGEDGHAESLRLSLRDVSGRLGDTVSGRAPGPASPRPARPPAARLPEVAVRGPVDASAGWCDTLLLPGGGMLLTLGRVAGGARCGAADPAMLRDALRGMAMTGAGPARMLRLLDRLAAECGGGAPVAALCCRCEPGEDGRPPTLVWARAGLAPPVLVRDGAVRPGAAAKSGGGQQRMELLPGDVVLCSTDGLLGAVEGVGAAAARVSAAGSASDCADLVSGLLGRGAGAAPAAGDGLLALRLG